ncbi:protein regulator of cytokinesis 1-like [Brevipalpus obovatus]|uniref:protein regulator of cytokinesis 1-like n=1 Tax=Brevipalpus obovatus TaxID=246614 RepID=UPI003D9E111B
MMGFKDIEDPRMLAMIQFCRDNRDFISDSSYCTDDEHDDTREAQDLNAGFWDHTSKMFKMWSEMGLCGTLRTEKRSKWSEAFRRFYQDTFEIDNTRYETMKSGEKEIRQMINKMIEQLNMDSWEPPGEMNLISRINKLEDKREELAAIKQERLDKWDQLDKVHCQLARNLGLDDSPVTPSSIIPSEADIQTIQSKVLELKKTHTRRRGEYTTLKKRSLELHRELEIEKITEDGLPYFVDESTIVLSDVLMKNFSKYCQNLETRFKANEQEKQRLLTRIIELWDKLEITEEERQEELCCVIAARPSDLKKLNLLLEKYEELKRQNMGIFICKLRGEIADYWEKCYVSQEDKDSFEVYMSQTEYDEPLLTAHEQELERWKMHYERNRNLFASLEKWQIAWSKLLDLQEECNNPNRFNNRGGVLLKQEKEKKRLQKELTRAEKDITELSKQWCLENGGFFMVEGLCVNDYIDAQKRYHQGCKENEKKKRTQYNNNNNNNNNNNMDVRSGQSIVAHSPMMMKGRIMICNSTNELGSAKRLAARATPLSPMPQNIVVNCGSSIKKPLGQVTTAKGSEKRKNPVQNPLDSGKKPRPRAYAENITSSASSIPRGKTPFTRARNRLFINTPHGDIETPESKLMNSTFRKSNPKGSPATYTSCSGLDRRKSRSQPLLQIDLSPVGSSTFREV